MIRRSAAALCLLLAAHAYGAVPQPGVLAELAYDAPGGGREVAVRIDRQGRAIGDLRRGRVSARFTAAQLRELCPSLYDGTISTLSQRSLNSDIIASAQEAGLRLPLPGAHMCRISLPTRRGTAPLACAGPAILASRLPDCEAVRCFERVRTDLDRLRAVLILGGYERAEVFRAAVSERSGADVEWSGLVFADDFAGERTAHFQLAGGTLAIVTGRGNPPSLASNVELFRPTQ